MPNIGSADPARLARFGAAAPRWEVTRSDETYGMVEGKGIRSGFGKFEGFRPAPWPDEAGARPLHLDLQVDDLDETTESLGAIGASRTDFQSGAGRRRVLLDPNGHPVCLSPSPLAGPRRPS